MGTSARAYTVAADSNRLTALSNPARSLAYDAAGNTLSDVQSGSASNYTATYSLEGRLAAMAQGSTAGVDFGYDAMGRRVVRGQWVGSPGAARTYTLFAYDQANHLLGEYKADGTSITEYVWLGDTPVAVLKPDGVGVQIYAVHTDHLNTPRMLVDANGQVRWRWLGEPFGASPAEEQPTAGLAPVQQQLRFPGQQYEPFGGRHYNHFRDYDPTVGRYVQSDPIGLKGGINTYAYVGGNPLSKVDPLGLWSVGGAFYYLVGGELNFGYDTGANKWFGCFRVGVGVGGGVSVDPLGGIPGDVADGTTEGASLGVFAEIGGEALGVTGKYSTNAGIRSLDKPKNYCPRQDSPSPTYATRPTPQASFGKPAGIKAVGAFGVEGCNFGASR